ncbi:hypothetical protein ACWOA0_00375 [Ignavigranum ruoffiae]|uniref:Uncharacterized protein n=1 Tax=Ignavigranum ruoffiae TaxID=89093 RepID=A0A1H8ZY24_9LACT|nr:hypothetical protein [Ignavigranum ruoffiae]UPQ85683.1 hypothetical protein M0R79_08530 [Ignavigranum ruoffiae]SEP69153.1 hypothetical protein SAMN04488558_101365 [Ignavigranum ruoffiae]
MGRRRTEINVDKEYPFVLDDSELEVLCAFFDDENIIKELTSEFITNSKTRNKKIINPLK